MFCWMECPKCNGGFSVPKTPDFDMDCSDLLCFVGWNAQTTMGFSVPKREICGKYWFLLDGRVNSNGGFPLSKCRSLKSIGFCKTGM